MKKCVLIIVSILTIAMSVLTMFVSEKRLAAKSLFWQMLTLWRGMKLAEGKYPEYLCLGLKVGRVALANQWWKLEYEYDGQGC